MAHESISTLDLRGTVCPMNFVKIKLELDRLGPGVRLNVTADSGATGRDILRSLEQQGFAVEEYLESEQSVMFVVFDPAT